MDYQNYNYQNNYQNNYRPPMQRSRIDNIFSALMYERTPGAIMEFSLWCSVCVVAFMAFIAAVLGDGNITWIMLMLFSIGMAVLMAFRLKPITLLYGVVTGNFITFIIHHFSMTYYEEGVERTILIFLFFMLLMLAAIILVIFAFIHFFSSYNFGNFITLMVLIHSGCALLLHILMYACPFIGKDASYANKYWREVLNERGYWLGTISYWVILIVICLFYAFFFWGFIDSRKGKIIHVSGMTRTVFGAVPALRGVRGSYAGQVIQLQGRELVIGSKQSHIVIADPYVSSRHCIVRFNTSTGYYEVCDNSSSGTFLHTGARLHKGTYNSIQRGSVIWIGSQNQQFQLM